MSDNPVTAEADLKLKYLDDYPKLPADAPLGCPHIVDLSSLDEDWPQAEMSIPDLVVTVLFKYRPAALDAFLDLKRKDVHFVRHHSRSATLDFCIQRAGRIVKVLLSLWPIEYSIDNVQIGVLNGREQGGWDLLFKYRIGAKVTGKWTPIFYQDADGYIDKDPGKFFDFVPQFAWHISDREVWDQDEPGLEIEWFAGLLQGRKH